MWLVLILIILCIYALYLIVNRLQRDYYILALCKRVKTQDGSPLSDKVYLMPGKTRFGNNFDLLTSMTAEKIFNLVRVWITTTKRRSFLLHFFRAPIYNIVNAEDADEVFQSPTLIKKNVVYELLKPFLGDGLLISTDKKWHFQRKTLTPAFHFNVLQTFLEIFKEESYKLINVLEADVGKQLILNHVIPQFTLNNVCETALGVKLDNIEGSGRYRDAIHEIEHVILKRLCNPLLYYKPILYIFYHKLYKSHEENLKIAHEFSSKIIQRKREEYKQRKNSMQETEIDDDGRKRRYAMLDTLLEVETHGQIDHQGICDEVNTFMFEGYDTTSTCLLFTLLNLATRADIQARCYREIEQLPSDISKLTVFDFNQLEYLECVIKESLRLYPSVPFIGRECVKETVINGMIFPEFAQINVHLFDIMRDPRHFPNPNDFKPERFFAENTVNRHPFAFVPFSAGQRNCIGQKFAILEIKVLLVAILKNFEILPVTRMEDIILGYGIVLRAQQNFEVKLVKRM